MGGSLFGSCLSVLSELGRVAGDRVEIDVEYVLYRDALHQFERNEVESPAAVLVSVYSLLFSVGPGYITRRYETMWS